MNIDYLVQLLGNRLNSLALAKDQAFMAGDLERINALDNEIQGVKDTLYKLNLLNSISATAVATGTTETSVVANGIEAIVDNGSVSAEAIKPLERYDISSYATDLLHEQKIATILNKMPLLLNTVEKIDQYIQGVVSGSPINGAMVLAAAQIYSVDQRLMLALMELDSFFGTLGVAVATMNPGNVGNTGTATRTYNSWSEGVTAVAEWLSRHHKVVLAVEEIKGVIKYDTVATSSIAVASSTIPVASPVSEPVATSTLSSKIEKIIEDFISPTSTTPIATGTDPIIIPALENIASSTVPNIATGTTEVISSASSTIGSATTTSI